MAHVRDESLYFHKWINDKTIIVLLTDAPLPVYDDIFQDYCSRKGCVVYKLGEKISFKKSYKLSKRSINIMDTLLNSYNVGSTKILTHPRYTHTSDPQNRALYDYIRSKDINKHYVFSSSPEKFSLPDDQKRILLKYSSVFKSETDRYNKFMEYAGIAETVGNLE